MMKKMMLFYGIVFLLLAGWIDQREVALLDSTLCMTAIAEEVFHPKESPVTIYPLPDTTMENLTDAMLSVSLAEGVLPVDEA